MEPEVFGRLLTARRESAGLSKEELARRTAVSPSSISRIESGEISPSYAVLCRLAKGLGVEVYELFLPVTTARDVRMDVLLDRLTGLPESRREIAMSILEGALSLAER